MLNDTKTCMYRENFLSCIKIFIHNNLNRCVAEIQIFEKTYLIVIKDETGLKFKINDSTLFLIRSNYQKLVASYKKNGEITQCLQKWKRKVRFLN